jgi:hypothetical protein
MLVVVEEELAEELAEEDLETKNPSRFELPVGLQMNSKSRTNYRATFFL